MDLSTSARVVEVDGDSGDETPPTEATAYLPASEGIAFVYLMFASFCRAHMRMADLMGADATHWDALFKEGRRMAARIYPT